MQLAVKKGARYMGNGVKKWSRFEAWYGESPIEKEKSLISKALENRKFHLSLPTFSYILNIQDDPYYPPGVSVHNQDI
jgi:hypothetical protein